MKERLIDRLPGPIATAIETTVEGVILAAVIAGGLPALWIASFFIKKERKEKLSPEAEEFERKMEAMSHLGKGY